MQEKCWDWNCKAKSVRHITIRRVAEYLCRRWWQMYHHDHSHRLTRSTPVHQTPGIADQRARYTGRPASDIPLRSRILPGIIHGTIMIDNIFLFLSLINQSTGATNFHQSESLLQNTSVAAKDSWLVKYDEPPIIAGRLFRYFNVDTVYEVLLPWNGTASL
jgi:hypothetical protein